MLLFLWFLRVYQILTLILTIFNHCSAFNKDDDPYKNHARITIQNGSVVFESAGNKDIVLNTPNGGSISLNGYNLNSLLETTTHSSDDLTSQTFSFQNKINNFEQQLNLISEHRLVTVEDRLEVLSSLIDEFIGTGNSRLNPAEIRRTIQSVLNLEQTLIHLTQKLSQNKCLSNPCRNGGKCVPLFDDFQCLCNTGWNGETCNVDVDECLLYTGTDIGCQNGATCVNTAGNYRCECKADWRGVHCTERHDDCDGASNNELCDHGTCVTVARRIAGQPNYRCVCDQGWTTDGVSPACDLDVDECSMTTPHCSVNPPVDCFNLLGSFQCGDCPPGFTGNGIVCVDINECESENGGCSQSPRVQCSNTFGSRICGPCPPGFVGDGVECTFAGLCEVNNGGCSRQATCVENNGDVVCECPAHFTGTGIGVNGCVALLTVDCASNPCLHGICHSITLTTFRCQCFDGWSGDLCDVRLDECSSNPCRNGGSCMPTDVGFQCICGAQWQGVICEDAREECGDVFEQSSGFIKYPLTNNIENQNEIDCVWGITTAVGKIVRFNFSYFSVETSVNCSRHFLQINDGQDRQAPEIGRYCGNLDALPNGGNFTSITNNVYIWYQASNVGSRDGFELSWNTTEVECGGVLRSETGEIKHPKNDQLYSVNEDCFWSIRVNATQRVQLHISFIAIENNTNCDHDYLKIYDGQLTSDRPLVVFCNSNRPSPLTSTNSDILVHFHSDAAVTDRGFHLTYNAISGDPNCGGIFTSQNGSFYSPNTTTSAGEIACNWLIRVDSTDKILVHFSQFELHHENCDFESVAIYDGESEEAPLIGRFCGTSLVEVMSSWNTLYIRYRANQLVDGNGFIANYTAFCGGYFNSETGVLKSPNYPNPYPANKRCVYHIEADAENIIELKFIDLDIEDLWDGCLHDFLEIREADKENGTVIGKLCGYHPPAPITSNVNEVWLTFVSDDSIHNRGFHVNYSFVNVGCGGVRRENFGTISSPSHFLNPLSANCTWVIVAPLGWVIRLTFALFSITASGGNCDNDFVKIEESDGTLMGKYCGELNLHAIQSRTNTLTVVYERRIFAPSEGFEINYEFLEVSSLCGGLFTAETGYIRSPNFPQSYFPNSNCTWIIKAESGHQISLEVKAFDLEDESCIFEYLEIRNGQFTDSPLVGKFCGNRMQSFVLSHSNTVSLYFYSNSTITGNGFEILFESVIRGCGGTVSQQSGLIISPNYPLAYNHDAVCDWIIHVSRGSVVEVTLEDIDFEETRNCFSDYLELFDGNSDIAPMITKICSMGSNLVYTSSRNVMFVKFRTDSRISFRGFKLSFDTKCINTVNGYRGVIESPNFPFTSLKEMNCLWTIQVPRGSNITFTFSHRDISFDSRCPTNYTRILESDLKQHYVVEVCANNSTEIPSTFNVSNNEVDIEFSKQTRTSVFRLEWIAVGCGGEIFGKTTGSFTTPNYPNGYPRNIECLWHIRVPLNNSVVLHFENFSLEMQQSMSQCNTDFVKVYGGPDVSSPLLTTLCHKLTNAETISSSGNEMTVLFKSDRSLTGKGFFASFEAKPGNCGGFFESVRGSFASKNYPGKYDANDDCSWLIKVNKFHRVELSFEDFDIPQSTNCSSSFLSIHDGDSIGSVELLRHCGNTNPGIIQSTDNQILVRLKGNGILAGKGFKINYSMICGGSLTIATNDHKSYELKSSNYPYKSIHLEFCSWILRAENPSQKLTLSFTRLKSSNELQCETDYVEVREGDTYDGPLIGRYCGTQIPVPIVSQGNTLYVYLRENAVFRATVTTTISMCGAVLDSGNGYFTSPGYPNDYPISLECIWTIRSSPGNRVTLSFQYFEIESSEFCNSDYVEVRENDSKGTLFGRFCGNTIPRNIPAANILWIKFRSDDFGSDDGFSAFYSLVHGVDITGTSGVLASPQYPEVVTTDEVSYTWTITSPEDTFIFVTFVDIEIVAPETGNNCANYVEISNGLNENEDPIAKYCGLLVPEPLVSSSNAITIRFWSSYPGKFKIEWEANTTSTIAMATSSSNSSIENVCGESIFINETSNFTFTSPGYPDSYESNLKCSWIFTTQPGYRLVLDVLEIDVENSLTETCRYDKLQFYEPIDYRPFTWHLNSTICGRKPIILASNSDRIKVDFNTDSTVTKKGFQIRVTPSCGGFIYKSFGIISTQMVMNNSNCVWTVNVRQGRTISVKFTELNIDDDSSCNSSFVMLRNGPTVDSPVLGNGLYCGSVIPESVETSSNLLFVKFSSRGNHGTRFRLEFKEVSEICGGSFQLSHVMKTLVISSPKYPLPPPHDFECDWIVSSPPNTNIRIDFEVSKSVPCNKSNEYIELRDGGTIKSRLIDRLCVPPKLSSHSSSENIMFIRFVTSGNSVFSTFRATANINICGGSRQVYQKTIIQSPNYPNVYSNNLDCMWRVQASSLQDIFSVTFDDIDLVSSSSDCSSGDVLVIKDGDENGEILGSYCSSSKNATVIKSKGSLLFIQFKSDQFNSAKGFSLTVKSEYNICGADIDPAVSGQISTPGFPNASLYPITCHWILRANFDRRIKLSFQNYNLKESEESPGKCVDKLRIIKAPIMKTRHEDNQLMPCNNLIPLPIESQSMGMSIIFNSDALNANEGFVATYTTDDEIQCGGEITEGNVDIISYGFPGTQFGNETLYCLWVINDENSSAQKTKAIIFSDFEIFEEIVNQNGAKECPFGEIVFGTGDADISTVNEFDRFCGNKTGKDFYFLFDSGISQNYIYLAMNYTASYRGIKAKFVIENCGGFFENEDYWNETSPGFPNGYAPNRLCYWQYNVEYGSKIQITFNSFELETDCEKDYLIIKNGLYEDSPVMGIYCGNRTPNVVTSSDGALSLIFRTDQFGTAPGFSFDVEILSKACGGFFSDHSKTISSPNYPKQYGNNVECIWHIEVLPSLHFEISFIDRFDIEMSNNCDNDFVLIEQNEFDSWVKIGQFCGHLAPAKLTAVSNNLRITFRTNSKITGDGFKLETTVKCGARFTEIGGVVTSPGYPVIYAPNTRCEFLIEDNSNDYMKLEFEDFDIESEVECKFDSVSIYAGNNTNALKYGPYCGKGVDNQPPVITTRGPMLIVFDTDEYLEVKGFKAKYMRLSCGGNLTDSNGEIESPNDGNKYMSDMNCVWNIRVEENKAIKIKFSSVSLEQCVDCNCDFVAIYDGANQSAPLIGKFCKLPLATEIKSSSNQLTIVFTSDRYVEAEGFKLVYESVVGEKLGCGGLLRSATGVVVSPDINGDGFYENELDCIWKILVAENAVIRMTFEIMDIEPDDRFLKCSYDYLEIRDGASYLDSLIGKYCGNEVPGQIISSENKLSIHFHSDELVNKIGFRIRYTSENSSCGSSIVVTNVTEIVNSPNYPLSFPPFLRCRYHFAVTGFLVERIRFSFTFFNLSCEDGDFIEIAEENNMGSPYRICGYKSSLRLVSVHGVRMILNTGAHVGDNRKFSLSVTVASCNETVDSNSGFIASTHYPFMTWSTFCVIHINTANDTNIALYFNDFNIDSNYLFTNCSIYNIKVISGLSEIATLCSGAVPNPLFVSSNQVTLIVQPSLLFKYFILYSSSYLEDGCGGNITSIDGVFTSPLYPQTYKRDATCVWYIRSLGMYSLRFSLTEFEFNSTTGCESNFVELYDGLDMDQNNFVARYCGGDNPAVHNFNGNTITVKMVTDITNNGVGFRAKFNRSSTDFASKHKIITSFSNPVVRSGNVYLSGL